MKNKITGLWTCIDCYGNSVASGSIGVHLYTYDKDLSLQRESGLQRKSNIEIKINGRKINETRRELQVPPTETTSPRWRTLVSRPEFSPTFFFSTATEQKSKHSSENKWLSLPPHPPSHPPPLPPLLPPPPPLDKEETEKRGKGHMHCLPGKFREEWKGFEGHTTWKNDVKSAETARRGIFLKGEGICIHRYLNPFAL